MTCFWDRECISCCHEGIIKVMTWMTGWKMLHLHHWNGNYGGLPTKHIPSGKLTFQWKMDLVKICSVLKNMFLPATPPMFFPAKVPEKWCDWSRRASPFGGMYPPTQRYPLPEIRPYLELVNHCLVSLIQFDESMFFNWIARWWQLTYFLFSSRIPGEMIQFDSYVSKGLKPPTRLGDWEIPIPTYWRRLRVRSSPWCKH